MLRISVASCLSPVELPVTVGQTVLAVSAGSGSAAQVCLDPVELPVTVGQTVLAVSAASGSATVKTALQSLTDITKFKLCI